MLRQMWWKLREISEYQIEWNQQAYALRIEILSIFGNGNFVLNRGKDTWYLVIFTTKLKIFAEEYINWKIYKENIKNLLVTF